jgi:thiol:disulfide interchange protein DsbG
MIFGLTLVLGNFTYAQEKTPEVISFFKSQGVEVVDTFKTDAGVMGYAVTVNGRALSIYLTPDNKHAMIGSLINAQGVDVGADAIQRLITGPANDKAWQRLEDANWVTDGKDTAPHIIYTFTDPNCPYCHKLREAAAAEIASGRVQLRHVLVGLIRQDSPSQAANILGAENPVQALSSHHFMLGKGGIKQNQQAIKRGNAGVSVNTLLLHELGYSATPTSFYKNENGQVVSLQGLPRAEALQQMLAQ